MDAACGGSPTKRLKIGVGSNGLANCAVLFVLCMFPDKHTVMLASLWADPTRESTFKSGPPMGHKRESEEYAFEDDESFINFAVSKGWKEFSKKGSSSGRWRSVLVKTFEEEVTPDKLKSIQERMRIKIVQVKAKYKKLLGEGHDAKRLDWMGSDQYQYTVSIKENTPSNPGAWSDLLADDKIEEFLFGNPIYQDQAKFSDSDVDKFAWGPGGAGKYAVLKEKRAFEAQARDTSLDDL